MRVRIETIPGVDGWIEAFLELDGHASVAVCGEGLDVVFKLVRGVEEWGAMEIVFYAVKIVVYVVWDAVNVS
jgi:hypothetical protein